MGIFTYTPEEKPAVAKVTYKEKEYKFNLPDALSAGYVLNVNNSSGAIVAKESTGPEMARVEEALGFLDDL